ncbi:hypothetical protein ACFOQM_22720 [Paenibacillus sp. GCM10012307]|uniref:Uncharacterized protein n=1 Tax=Paenibacillus roseus TaxID=2798579 RepID=A0A934MSK8_9BACL|nr:hypothetical protein [Paenibacillus roseus]MBJ6364043.1 hypothetical protein [Paenibacillus roseus]
MDYIVIYVIPVKGRNKKKTAGSAPRCFLFTVLFNILLSSLYDALLLKTSPALYHDFQHRM